MISASNMYVTFGKGTALENKALRGVDIELSAGEFVTVIGSNGAGKSTLLNALSGEVMLDKGKIIIDGEDVSKLSTHQRARIVARVFQNPLAGSCEALSIEENLALAIKRGQCRTLGRAVKAAYIRRFKEALAHLGLGLEHRLKDSMGLLSGGQRQAVSLLMASLTPSSILLLDEHTAALDPKTANFVIQLSADLISAQKLTTLMVTHSMRQALDVGSRTLMLHQGKVVFDIGTQERQNLKVADLLKLFEQKYGDAASDDTLLLG